MLKFNFIILVINCLKTYVKLIMHTYNKTEKFSFKECIAVLVQ